MPEPAIPARVAPAPRVSYRPFEPGARVPRDALALLGFGSRALPDDPRCLRVGLEPLHGAGLVEVWHASGAVESGHDGAIRWTRDAHHLAGVLELDERAYGGIAGAAQAAYTAIREFQARSAWPHLLRMWNYCDAINRGEGDDERYRQFCVGRAIGLAASCDRLPAATAIGRRDGSPLLQVYWLAAREPGLALENPRQVSAYRYPRQYGVAAPSFSRAMLDAARERLLISGTASVVGHASHHPGDVSAQLRETLTNLDHVLARAAMVNPDVPRAFTAHSALKVYLRQRDAAGAVAAALHAHAPDTPFLILEGDICRADLLVEIDGEHSAAGARV